MADSFGPFDFSGQAPPEGALSDPALDKIAAFVNAVLLSKLGSAWNQVDPGGKPVNSVFIADPKVTAINNRDLPSLYIWRSRMHQERVADDYYIDRSEISILWIASPQVQAKQQARLPVFNGIAKTIYWAFVRGRDESWVDSADTTNNKDGSEIASACGFLYPPELTHCEPYIYVQHVDQMSGAAAARYPGVLAKISGSEQTVWDPSIRGAPAAHTTTVSNNGVPLVEVEDPVTP